jgi:hypothetical protein
VEEGLALDCDNRQGLYLSLVLSLLPDTGACGPWHRYGIYTITGRDQDVPP